MAEEAGEDESGVNPHIKTRHINKRALKNKSLAVSFSEKDLKDYVTGFHKRKKKRRREAQTQIQESDRKKRIELRKKRKLEREFAINGGAPADENAAPDEADDDNEEEEEEVNDSIASVSGTTMYDNGDVKVMVTTSEISHEEEEKKDSRAKPNFAEADPGKNKKKTNNVGVIKKKPFKKVAKKRSRPKSQTKREKRKSKVNNKSNDRR